MKNGMRLSNSDSKKSARDLGKGKAPEPPKVRRGTATGQVEMATKAVKAPAAEPEKTEESSDSPLIDSVNQAIKKMIARAKERGYVTYDEINEAMPAEQVSSEQIEDTMAMLSEMGVNIVENDEESEEAELLVYEVVDARRLAVEVGDDGVLFGEGGETNNGLFKILVFEAFDGCPLLAPLA